MGPIDTPAETVELIVPDLGPAADHAVVVTWMKNLGDRVEVDEAICRLAVGDLEFEVCSTADGELTRIVADRGSRVLERSTLAEVGVAAPSPDAIEPDGADPEPLPSEDLDDDEPSAEPQPPKVELEITPEPIDPEFAPTDPVVEPPPVRFPSQPLEPDSAPAEPDPASFEPSEPAMEAAAPPPPTPAAEPPPSAVEAEPPRVEPEPPAAEPEHPAPEPELPAAEPELPTAPAAGPVPSGDDVDWSQWISPAVRMVAEERGIDLSHVRGTGIGGRIRKRDVLRHPGPGAGAGNA